MSIKTMSFGALVFICCCLGFQASAADLQPGSVWMNEKGSTMTINTVDSSTGLVSGTFKTGVGCGVGIERPLTGIFNQGAFTFAVNFQECLSTTAWAGVLNTSGDEIRTLWHLALSGDPKWNSIIAGADAFTKQ